MNPRSTRVPTRTFEDLLASLRRIEATLDATEARLRPPADEASDEPPVRTLHRVP